MSSANDAITLPIHDRAEANLNHSKNQAPRRHRLWHYHPALPIANSPVFSWPPRPAAAVRWMLRRWVVPSGSLLFLILAFVVVELTLPEPEIMQVFSADWILQIYVRNLLLMLVIAGGLHLHLHTLKAQGDRFQFDHRKMATRNRVFLFRDQVKDNMFWSLSSGVGAWTAIEILYHWCAANEFITTLSIAEHPVWFVASFFIFPMLTSMHSYWIHRLLHWPPLYRRFHSLHHRNINIGPWSGMSMHPVESVLYMSALLMHLVIPSHLIVVIWHFFSKALGPSVSHAGFGQLEVKDRKAMGIGDFHHQLHHRYFDCNYGTDEMPWDLWFGSFHDGTDAANNHIQARRKLKRGDG